MAKFSLKETIGYKYNSPVLGDYIVVGERGSHIFEVKLLDKPTFRGECESKWGRGYATVGVTATKNRKKIPYFDESITIVDILKSQLTLK